MTGAFSLDAGGEELPHQCTGDSGWHLCSANICQESEEHPHQAQDRGCLRRGTSTSMYWRCWPAPLQCKHLPRIRGTSASGQHISYCIVRQGQGPMAVMSPAWSHPVSRTPPRKAEHDGRLPIQIKLEVSGPLTCMWSLLDKEAPPSGEDILLLLQRALVLLGNA